MTPRHAWAAGMEAVVLSRNQAWLRKPSAWNGGWFIPLLHIAGTAGRRRHVEGSSTGMSKNGMTKIDEFLPTGIVPC